MSAVRFLLASAAIALIAADAPRTGSYTIRWDAGGGPAPATVEVIGVDPANLSALAKADWDATRWSGLFSVSIAGASADAPAIVGSYRVAGPAIRFVPRFPIEPGLRHSARFRPSRLPIPGASPAPDVIAEFTRPAPPPPAPASVVRVDPTGRRVPENLLRIYLHFSQPMGRGEAYRHVRILDASGRAVERPFLELGEELWDPSGTRLTLLLDPGRIKRGLRPREEEGPILEAGKTYTLVVDRAWPDAAGQPLRESFRKSFTAGAADETQPDPARWKVGAPPAGTREPITLTFPEPLDRAMLERVLVVHDPEGRRVAGRVAVEAEESRWRFRPEEAWNAGTYRVVVDVALEDLAGNSIARPFEVDVLGPITRRPEVETVSVPVAIRDGR